MFFNFSWSSVYYWFVVIREYLVLFLSFPFFFSLRYFVYYLLFNLLKFLLIPSFSILNITFYFPLRFLLLLLLDLSHLFFAFLLPLFIPHLLLIPVNFFGILSLFIFSFFLSITINFGQNLFDTALHFTQFGPKPNRVQIKHKEDKKNKK